MIQFLKKLFGNDPLQSATEAPVASALPKTVFKDRAARVQLLPIHRAGFKLGEIEYGLSNISKSGMALLKTEPKKLFEVGSTAEGTLRVGPNQYPVRMTVARETEKVVGLRFQNPAPELSRAIDDYFEYEFAALKMTRIKSEILKPIANGKPHFIHGQNSCELYFIETNGEITHFQASIFGNYVEGNLGKPPRYGEVISDEDSDRVKFKGSDIIQWNSGPVIGNHSAVIRFIGAVPHLSQKEREGLIRVVGPSSEKVPPAR